jgi:uncharacterized oligopeptide transporter (OPT) family protein
MCIFLHTLLQCLSFSSDSQTSGSSRSLSHFLPQTHVHQIIEEKLPFPSGTATAHLVSVLYRLPPPETSLRHRQGYRRVDDSEATDDRIYESTAVEHEHESEAEAEAEDAADEAEIDIVEHEGLRSLIWSFVCSGVLAVRSILILGYCAKSLRASFSSSLTFSRLYLRFPYWVTT